MTYYNGEYYANKFNADLITANKLNVKEIVGWEPDIPPSEKTDTSKETRFGTNVAGGAAITVGNIDSSLNLRGKDLSLQIPNATSAQYNIFTNTASAFGTYSDQKVQIGNLNNDTEVNAKRLKTTISDQNKYITTLYLPQSNAFEYLYNLGASSNPAIFIGYNADENSTFLELNIDQVPWIQPTLVSDYPGYSPTMMTSAIRSGEDKNTSIAVFNSNLFLPGTTDIRSLADEIQAILHKPLTINTTTNMAGFAVDSIKIGDMNGHPSIEADGDLYITGSNVDMQNNTNVYLPDAEHVMINGNTLQSLIPAPVNLLTARNFATSPITMGDVYIGTSPNSTTIRGNTLSLSGYNTNVSGTYTKLTAYSNGYITLDAPEIREGTGKPLSNFITSAAANLTSIGTAATSTITLGNSNQAISIDGSGITLNCADDQIQILSEALPDYVDAKIEEYNNFGTQAASDISLGNNSRQLTLNASQFNFTKDFIFNSMIGYWLEEFNAPNRGLVMNLGGGTYHHSTDDWDQPVYPAFLGKEGLIMAAGDGGTNWKTAILLKEDEIQFHRYNPNDPTYDDNAIFSFNANHELVLDGQTIVSPQYLSRLVNNVGLDSNSRANVVFTAGTNNFSAQLRGVGTIVSNLGASYVQVGGRIDVNNQQTNNDIAFHFSRRSYLMMWDANPVDGIHVKAVDRLGNVIPIIFESPVQNTTSSASIAVKSRAALSVASNEQDEMTVLRTRVANLEAQVAELNAIIKGTKA